MPYTIVRACFSTFNFNSAARSAGPVNGTDIHGAAPACKRVTMSNGLVLSHPVRNPTSHFLPLTSCL